jgi:hypothetical protein
MAALLRSLDVDSAMVLGKDTLPAPILSRVGVTCGQVHSEFVHGRSEQMDRKSKGKVGALLAYGISFLNVNFFIEVVAGERSPE